MLFPHSESKMRKTGLQFSIWYAPPYFRNEINKTIALKRSALHLMETAIKLQSIQTHKNM